MTRNIADVRRDYEGGRLDETHTPDDPFVMFDEWFSLALESEGKDGNAMTLVRLRVKRSGISFEVNIFLGCTILKI